MSIDIQVPLCPMCGAVLNVTEGASSVKCKFCRNTVIVTEAVKQGRISVDGIPTLADRIDSGYTFLEIGDYDRAFVAFNHAIQIAPNNYRVWWGLVLAGTKNFTTFANGTFKEYALKAVEFAPDKLSEENMRAQFNRYIDAANRRLDYTYGDGWKQTR